jgi:hypothetical protein
MLRCVQGSLVTLSESEGSLAMGVEMLRGVYTERSECAQHDNVPLHDRASRLPRRPSGRKSSIKLRHTHCHIIDKEGRRGGAR